ncbi:cytochrome c oxidase assembly protein COX16-domain-containing protein [Mycena alexandri]|uniref:Cytochrome c oxidase assembly protein COX16, mitochondrial n=1 Tax=Mycena alexandri TaxID=1745969 RepID=A0AAD6SUD4_9AGAR|nr:cytochrome c oxidase assembly protein COX16-domain-containing protein [Mycena alexandri]
MAVLPSRPLNPSRLNTLVRKQPLYFGIPFVLLMVGASFGLTAFTQTKYDYRDKRVKQVTKEQELKLDHDRKKFDIREEYFRLSAQPEEDWDMKRVPRPKGTPEWGLPPPEPEAKPPATKS